MPVSTSNDDPKKPIDRFRMASLAWMASGIFAGLAVGLSSAQSSGVVFLILVVVAIVFWLWGKGIMSDAEALLHGYVSYTEKRLEKLRIDLRHAVSSTQEDD